MESGISFMHFYHCMSGQPTCAEFFSEKAGGECLEKTKTRKDNQISNVLRRDHTVRTYDGFRNVDCRKEDKVFFRNPNAAFEMTKTFPHRWKTAVKTTWNCGTVLSRLSQLDDLWWSSKVQTRTKLPRECRCTSASIKQRRAKDDKRDGTRREEKRREDMICTYKVRAGAR